MLPQISLTVNPEDRLGFYGFSVALVLSVESEALRPAWTGARTRLVLAKAYGGICRGSGHAKFSIVS
jgi:hypothetical protein